MEKLLITSRVFDFNRFRYSINARVVFFASIVHHAPYGNGISWSITSDIAMYTFMSITFIIYETRNYCLCHCVQRDGI